MKTAIAWIDETEEKGLVRNLTEGRDNLFALVVAIVVPDDSALRFRELLQVPYDEFKAATPADEKLHITDAFASTNAEWRSAGHKAREDIRAALIAFEPVIVYGARRLRDVRITHAAEEQQIAESIAHSKERRPELDFKRRPPADRVETQSFDQLSLFLDCLGKDLGLMIAVHSDHMVDALADDCEEAIEESMSVTSSAVETQIFNRASKQLERRGYVIQLSTNVLSDSDINLSRVHPTIKVCDGVGPELLAVDVVANDLGHHFKSLAPTDLLYGSQATRDWWGASLIYGSNRDDIPMFNIF